MWRTDVCCKHVALLLVRSRNTYVTVVNPTGKVLPVVNALVGDDICDVVHVMVDELTAFERLKKTYNVVMNQMLTKYRHIFDDEITGMTDHEHHIFL
jgi:hypothetical protein